MKKSLLGVGGVALLGAVGIAAFARGQAQVLAAFLGLLCAVGSSVLALRMKETAVRKSLNAAMASVGMVFGGRVVLVAVGTGVAGAVGGQALAFVLAFFGAYFPIQIIEMSFVLAERRREV